VLTTRKTHDDAIHPTHSDHEPDRPATVCWWTSRFNPKHAGIRIRAHLVIRELRRQGCAAGWFDPRVADPAHLHTLVVHMRYDDASQRQVAMLRRRGVRIVFDMCDNHFYAQPGQHEKAARAAPLRQMLQLADEVIVSTPELGAAVQAHASLATAPRVIPDACDDLSCVKVPLIRRLRAQLSAVRLRRRVRVSESQGRVPLIWFGHHGTYDDVGMLDLLRIRTELERLDRSLPLHLSVVSNNRDKFRAHLGGWSFPVEYAQWSASQFGSIARMHRIALVPVVENDFTRGKTANRLTTAFAHGLAVVADPLPSYRRFAGCAAFGNWADSIARYATDEAARTRDVEAGRRLAEASFGIATVARQWRDVLGL
jgi:hypothetical protein